MLASFDFCSNFYKLLEVLTLYLSNSIFALLHFDAFSLKKSNKFAIVVHFLYFV
jgi:hypothetical protein